MVMFQYHLSCTVTIYILQKSFKSGHFHIVNINIYTLEKVIQMAKISTSYNNSVSLFSIFFLSWPLFKINIIHFVNQCTYMIWPGYLTVASGYQVTCFREQRIRSFCEQHLYPFTYPRLFIFAHLIKMRKSSIVEAPPCC